MEEIMKKTLLLILCLILAMSLALTSCKKNKDDPSKDDPGENVTPETPEEPEDPTPPAETVCAHEGTLLCTKCYEPVYTEGTLPAIPVADSFGAKVTDLNIVLEDSPEHAGTVTMKIIEGYLSLDAEGMLQGYGTAELAMAYSDYSRNDTLAADIFIEDNVLYISTSGSAFDNTEAAGATYGMMDISKMQALVDIKEQLAAYQPMMEQYMPVLEGWLTGSLLPIFENVNIRMDTDFIAKLAVKAINSFFVAADNADGTTSISLDLSVLKDWNKSLAEKPISELVDLIMGDGSFASVEDLILSDALYNYSVADLINYLKNEQGIDPIKLLASLDALATELSKDPESIAPAEKVTFESVLIPLLNSYLPEENQLPADFDLDTYLTDNDFLKLAVKDALQMLFVTETADEAVAMAQGIVTEYLGMAKTLTVYDLFISVKPSSPEIVLPVNASDASENQYDLLVKEFNKTIDELCEYFSYTITANADDMITKTELKVNVPALNDSPAINFEAVATAEQIKIGFNVGIITKEAGKITFIVTPTKFTAEFDLDIEDDMDVSIKMEILPGHTMTAPADKLAAIKAQIAKFDGKLTAEALCKVLNERIEKTGLNINKYYAITDGETVYWIYVNSYDYTVDEATGEVTADVVFSVDAYDPENYYAIVVNDGCNGIIAVEPTFNTKSFDDVSITITYTPGDGTVNPLYWITAGDIQDLEMQNPDLYENSNQDQSMILNTVSGELGYNKYSYETRSDANGHLFVLKDSKVPGDTVVCTEVYWEKYACSVCNKEVTYYYSEGHDTYYDFDSTVIPETCNTDYNEYYRCSRCDYVKIRTENTGHTPERDDVRTVLPGSCNAFYTVYISCTVCGEVVDSYVERAGHIDMNETYTYDPDGVEIGNICLVCYESEVCGYIGIYSDLNYVHHVYTGGEPFEGATIEVTIDEANAGSYVIYSEYFGEHVDPLLDVYIYNSLSGEYDFYGSDDDSGSDSQFYLELDLAAGNKYVFVLDIYGNHTNYLYDVTLEAAV